MSEANPIPDQVTAELGYLRACIESAQATPEAFDLAILLPRLGRAVAAVEAVLAAHRPVADEKGRDRCACCRATSPTGQRALWPCGEFQIVSRALLGGEPGA